VPFRDHHHGKIGARRRIQGLSKLLQRDLVPLPLFLYRQRATRRNLQRVVGPQLDVLVLRQVPTLETNLVTLAVILNRLHRHAQRQPDFLDVGVVVAHRDLPVRGGRHRVADAEDVVQQPDILCVLGDEP